MILRYRVNRAKSEGGQGAEELRTAIHELQVEIDELRAEQAAAQAELHERIDFAERLLTARAPERRKKQLLQSSRRGQGADHAVRSHPC